MSLGSSLATTAWAVNGFRVFRDIICGVVVIFNNRNIRVINLTESVACIELVCIWVYVYRPFILSECLHLSECVRMACCYSEFYFLQTD